MRARQISPSPKAQASRPPVVGWREGGSWVLTVVLQRASAQYKQAGEWARAGEVFAKMGDIAKRQVLHQCVTNVFFPDE